MSARPAPLTRDDLDAIRSRHQLAVNNNADMSGAMMHFANATADVPALLAENSRLRSKNHALEMLVRSSKGQADEWDLALAAGNPAYSAEFVRGAKELSEALTDGINQHPTWQDEH